MIQNVRVLIADDNVAETRALGEALVAQGYFCDLARNELAAFTALASSSCQVVICDVRMGSAPDLQLLGQLRSKFSHVPVIILTSDGTPAEAVRAIKQGAFQYLTRPCSTADLCLHISAAISDHARSLGLLASAPASVDSGLIAHESSIMKALLETVTLVAASSASVLITGESGTGKELIARAIHARGQRASRPFVAVNMSALPETLLESELFGHVRGAYTGALQARAGLFAEADGGTLLLDEIGDMPKMLQPKILRALQFGELRPVGSDRTRRVDVRVIAATHRDLSILVNDGLFRDDLRYRLNTIVLRVPPLRERREDIAVLVAQSLAAARLRSPASRVTSIDAAAMALLEQAPWPGNVRELESAVERVVVLGREPTVTPHDLVFLALAPPALDSDTWPSAHGQRFTLREMNQRYLAWMLKQTDGDKARAAEVLGIDVSTLYRWQRAKN